MRQSAFIFGRTPSLSLLELQAVQPDAVSLTPGIALVSGDISYNDMITLLGGTVKIAEIISTVPEVSVDTLFDVLKQTADGTRVTFGISTYGSVALPELLKQDLKKRLVEGGYTARFVETHHEQSLSSVVIAKQHVIDLAIIAHDGSYLLGITRAVQDFEDWNARDFGRPAPDPKRGMLPPKVARMIVNIARLQTHADHPMILDPFCGVGTILGEAALMGCNVTGTDISHDAIDRAKKNHEWLRAKYPQIAPLYANYAVLDATHLSESIARESIDAIVTEPFMGENLDTSVREQESPEKVKNTLKGLEKLYIGSLKEWQTILKKGALVIMAMPAYATRRAVMRVKNVVDRCESLGYTLLTGPIEYSRPNAAVRREFYIFQKNYLWHT